jgi:hypothetical protein
MKRYAFFTGMGRSGTKFVTSLLSHCTEANVVHENIGNREYWLLAWYLGRDYQVAFLEKEKLRIEKIYPKNLFVDVNGYLQHSVETVQELFKPVRVFHLVRDPRNVVRSLYTRRHDGDTHIVPKSDHEIRQWLEGDKFYQVCWNWADTTRRLLTQDTYLVRFEDIQSDYETFSKQILTPLGLNLPAEKWDEVRNTKVNETKPAWYRKLYARYKGKRYISDRLPPYQDWSPKQKEIFESVCGKIRNQCGYP